MTSHLSNDNKADFLSPSSKDSFSPPYNNKKRETANPILVPSLPSPTSNIHSNNSNKEDYCFIEYIIKPLPFAHEHRIVYDNRQKFEKCQLCVPLPYPYSQQQQQQHFQQISPFMKATTETCNKSFNLGSKNNIMNNNQSNTRKHPMGGSEKKRATTQKKKQITKTSSSTSSNGSNSKKRAASTSDANNGSINKEGVEKKRRRKSQGQQEDDNEKNKIPKTERPRWTREERYLLLKVIIGEKKLEQMRTFHWEYISQQVGKKKKTCKDQWRLELLPFFLDMFSETTGTNEPSYFEEEESDDSDGDTDECLNEIYCDVFDENEHDNNKSRI